MPKGEEIQVIAELTHLTVHAVRAVNGTIEAGGECMLDNKQGLEALLAAVIPPERPETFKVATVWPDDTRWHLSTDTEAFLDRTGDSLIKIAAASRGESKEPFAYAACNAGDGRSITSEGTVKWVLASTSRDSLDTLAESLPGHRLSWAKASPAALARVGGIAAALRGANKGSVALWDLGATHSHLIVVTSGGIEGVADCTVGTDHVFQAIQSALKLKFRGAGARLFINDGYDFTDAAPKISAAIGPAFKQAFALLPISDPLPALTCIGLTGKQNWFLREMAAAAGTALWEPDLAKLTSNLGLKYADDAVAASFTASSIGLLESLFSRIRSKETWQPSWVEAEIPEEDLAAPEAEEAQERFVPPTSAAFRAKPSLPSENAGPPPPVVPKPPRPVPTPVIETMDEPAVEIPVPGAVASAVAAAPEPPDVLHSAPPPPDPSAPSFPLPGSAPTAAPVRKPPPVMAIPKAAVTSLPFEAAEVTVLPPQDEKEMTKSRLGFYVAVVAGAALVFAAIAVVVDARMEKMKEQDRAQEEAKAHHLAEVQLERAEHLAKVKEAQSRQEVQTAIVQTQKTTEEATRKSLLAEMEAKRIADLPGGLSLATSPAGASVSIDGKPPIASPLVLTGLSPGPHRIRIVLARHDPVELTTEIKASKTSDLGTITLESALGVLAVTSSPDDLEFAVRPAANPSGAPLRTGRTPASLEGIPRGDYLVTYARPGCRDHVEKASVRKGAKGAVDTKYLDGSLELTSDPSGAWVDKDGIRLGSTPLVLHDLTPKEAFFQLTLPGYDPTPVSCAIPEGQTIKMNAQLLRRDRVFTVGEVKSLPSSYISPPPELTAAERKTDAEVTVSLIVQRDGTVVDVKVEKATDDDIGRRCANAVSRWKFHPGTASDDRTVDVQLEVPFRFAALP